jgi:hypothetical protein
MAGIFARVMWTQILNEVYTIGICTFLLWVSTSISPLCTGDVGSINRDVIFPSRFLRDEAVSTVW